MATIKQLHCRWLPSSSVDRFFVAILAVALVVTILGYPFAADEVPIHFNRSFEPDIFVAKPAGPFVLLAVAVILYGVGYCVATSLRLIGLDALDWVGLAVKSIQLVTAVAVILLNLFICFGPTLFGYDFK